MSNDEIRDELQQMTKSGGLSQKIAHEASRHPLAAESLIRLDRLERETDRQGVIQGEMHTALFGSDNLGIEGLIHDVRFLKINYWRGIWTIAGGMAVAGALIATSVTLFGLYIEWHKP